MGRLDYVQILGTLRASLKDHHPHPSMEQILSKVCGFERFSFLGEFSRYNQVLVQESNRYKTAFITKWATYLYSKMPFRLNNVGATFQNAMEMAFKNMLERFVLVYLDDIIVYSKNVTDHFGHLRQVFTKWREYSVSLNPSKCVFSTNQGKLLGHIVSKEGLAIDPKKKKAILALPLPTHKKGLQIFISRINFVRRFTHNLTTMGNPLTTILKMNMFFTQTREGRASFEEIKESITSTPTLINPNFDNHFILYTLGAESSISAILTQLNDTNEEQLITFFSEGLKDYDDKNSYVENMSSQS